MRDLALIVSVIVLGIMIVGVISVVTVFRTPTTQFGRALTVIINAASIIAGTWFALLDIGLGARIFGGCVAVLGAVSAFRLLTRRDT